MITRGLLLWALLFAALGVRAQEVTVEVTLAQDVFLPQESIPAIIRIVNRSGRTLHFGKEKWLDLNVDARDAFIVSKVGDPELGHDFTVANSETAIQHADLQPCFPVSRSGHYSVTATLTLQNWNEQITSVPTTFEIIQGTKLWEKEFGVPEGTNNSQFQPEIRKYILQRAVYLRHNRLYFRLTDATETHTFRVLPIGTVVSFSQPQTILDAQNNLHVLYTDSARSYSYSMFNPDGDMLIRQNFVYSDTAPRMRLDEKGRVMIAGGLRHATPTDLPAPKKETAAANQ